MIISTSSISSEIDWIAQRIDDLLQKNVSSPLPLPTVDVNSPYGKLVNEYHLNDADRVLLNLAFASIKIRIFQMKNYLLYLLSGTTLKNLRKKLQMHFILKLH